MKLFFINFLKTLVALGSFYSLAQASLLNYEVTSRQHKTRSLSEVCEHFGHEHNLIVRAKNTSFVNCMGVDVSVHEYCLEQELPNAYLRAYIPYISDDEKQLDDQVFCVSGSAVRLSLSCESEKTRHYCEGPKKSCEKLKKDLAYELDLRFYSRQFDKDEEVLHCHYGKDLLGPDEEVPDTPHILPIIPSP